MQVTDDIVIDEGDLVWNFVRASGPGGQHVNKAATAAELRLDVRNCHAIPGHVEKRLRALAGSRMTEDGVLIIDAREHRSQSRNRDAARHRLKSLLRKAAKPRKRRRKTKPTRASNRRRLERKKHRGQIKKLRKPPRLQ